MMGPFKTYKLMYRFGAWVTKEKYAAESDEEAIFDADQTWADDDSLRSWPYEVALWCMEDNRIVKTYKEANDGTYIRQQ